MAEMWRLFVALGLPEDVRAHLAMLQDALKQHAPTRTVRWVDPASIHLTLKFLGDAPSSQRRDLEQQLLVAAADLVPFRLAAGGLGCFPSPTRPRVAWVGVHGQLHDLHALRDAVERSIAPLGFPTEERPFHPHLTLGRVRQEAHPDDVRRLGEAIAHSTLQDRCEWQVNSVTLYRSELTPEGSIYTALCSAALRR